MGNARGVPVTDPEPIYTQVNATADGMVCMELFLRKNDAKIYSFAWDPEDTQAVIDALTIAKKRAEARREWIAGQQEDNYIVWLEEQWKGDSDQRE